VAEEKPASSKSILKKRDSENQGTEEHESEVSESLSDSEEQTNRILLSETPSSKLNDRLSGTPISLIKPLNTQATMKKVQLEGDEELSYRDFDTVQEMIAENFNPLYQNKHISSHQDIRVVVNQYQ